MSSLIVPGFLSTWIASTQTLTVFQPAWQTSAQTYMHSKQTRSLSLQTLIELQPTWRASSQTLMPSQQTRQALAQILL